METTFPNGDILTLTHTEVKFYGYKQGYLYELSYGERCEGSYGEDVPTPADYYFMATDTEYYPSANQAEVVTAFVERSTNVVNRTTKSHHLDDCLEREDKTSKEETPGGLGALLREKLRQTDEDRIASLLKRLAVYATYKDNWGGEEEKEVNAGAVSNAKKFVLQFPDNVELPSIAVGANGYVMLYGDLSFGYWEVVFTSETNTSFFSRKITGAESFKENLQLEEVTPKWFSENIEPLTVVPA